jgi:hypothetical protein
MADIGTLSPEQMVQQQQILRQQKMAEMLMNKPTAQGQMIGNRYVAPSFTQYAADLANVYVGNRNLEKADEKQLALAQQLRDRNQKDVEGYIGAMTPTTQTTEMAGPYGMSGAGQNVPMPTATQTQGPDLAKAFRIAYGSYDPALKSMALDMIKTQKLGPDESLIRPNFTGGTDVVMSGPPKVGQDLKDAAREAKLDINRIDSWSPQDWARVRTVESNAALAKRPANIVNIPNFAEKTFAGGLAENQVKKFDTLQTNAEKAPDVLRSVGESKAILKSGKFFSGSPANVQLEMAKMADAFGLGGTDTKTKAANTQTLITNAAGSTLDSIAGSGLGAGQGFTDKDLKFLQEAKSFRVDMTDTNINRILNLQERAAKASVNRYNERLSTLPQTGINSMGLRPIVLPRTADDIVKE